MIMRVRKIANKSYDSTKFFFKSENKLTKSILE